MLSERREMALAMSVSFLCLFQFFILFASRSAAVADLSNARGGRIGVIVDCRSRAGREERVAVEMAIEDFHHSTGRGPALVHPVDAEGDPVLAASAAISLINEEQVHALIGLRTWQEAAFVAEIGERAHVPILTFARTSPPSAAERWPFLFRVARGQHEQMLAVAAVVSYWQWRKVTIVYEGGDYTDTSIIPHLADALRDVGSEISHRVAVPSSAVTLTEKLKELKSGQCRVFIVHTSIDLAAQLFAKANEMNMMESSYVWIVTDGITSLLDSLNESTIASMQGVLGVSNYFVPSSSVPNFNARFNTRFRLKYPQEKSYKKPQFLPYLAYDAAWAVAKAMEKINPTNYNSTSKINRKNSTDLIPIWVSPDGLELSESIRQSNFSGLNGQFYFVDGEFPPPRAFQLMNVVGKSYRELGFWSHELGFSKSMDQGEVYGSSMMVLGQVFWPGGPWTVPRGWALPTIEKPLKIAVPENAVFPDFVSVKYGQNSNAQPLVEGFSIDVFRETVKNLPYNLTYNFVSYNGTYDCLMEHDHMKDYDVLVGDTSISSTRYHYVEFSQPYTESGLVMVVPQRLNGASRAWIFLKPFTAPMWGIILAIGLYNGLVVWMIERNYNSEFSGSFWNQLSKVLWVSFITLLSPGEKLHSNLSRVAMVVWLFVTVILTTNYTASLSSLLTVQRLEDSVTVESLRSSNAIVGCTRGSVVGKYLKEVLLFNSEHIKELSNEEGFRNDLLSGEIKAAFLRISHAKLLLAKYCNEFTIVGPEYHVGGLGFGVSQVFPKGTPLLSDISQAILEIFETGMIQKLESKMLGPYNCSSATTNDSDEFKLSPGSFWGLFSITIVASTACLTVYGVFLHNKKKHTTHSENLLAVVVDPGPSSEKIDMVDLRGFSPDINESLCTQFEIECENQGTSAEDVPMVVEDCAGTHQVIEESHT